MAISMNSIIEMITSQQNANMQSHMRGYAHSENFQDYHSIEEQIKREELKRNFEDFLSAFCRFVYRKNSLINEKEQNFSEFMYAREINLNLVAEYLEIANEELLNNPNFTNELPIKYLGDEAIIIKDIHPSRYNRAEISMSYIAGITNDAPNIIRIGITEEYNDGYKFLNGNIDICSDGEIIIHNFDKTTFKIKWNNDKKYIPVIDENGNVVYDVEKSQADIKDSAIDFEQIDEISNFFMHIFELADLKTQRSNIHR